MTTIFLGAAASSAGDDFHELWALHKILRLLDYRTTLRSVKVEGVPDDERHGELGAKAQAVDITEAFEDETGGLSYVYEQLKYSSADPDRAWSWARLTSDKGPNKPGTSVLGKLAQVFAHLGEPFTFRIVTNQPAPPHLDEAIDQFVRDLETPESSRTDDLVRLQAATGLDDLTLVRFLRSWDTSTFAASSRQLTELEIIKRLSDLMDADARGELDRLQQQVAALVLPEGQRNPVVRKQTLLTWLGVGSNELLFPVQSTIEVPTDLLPRACTSDIAKSIVEAQTRLIVLHASAGCGKTTFLATLEPALPAGSIAIVYDCYGGELNFASDHRRHLPDQAFIQTANEIAARLGTPFVLRKETSRNIAAAFLRRVQAGAELLGETAPGAILALCFDAADNARGTSAHWNEPCFLDELFGLSVLPDNVRIIVSCRTGRRTFVGAPSSAKELRLAEFSEQETLGLMRLHHPDWPDEVGTTLHQLASGTPRRLQGALKGAKSPGEAIRRLLPKADGLDGLFDQLVENAGARLGNRDAVWRLLCAVANVPRPAPSWVLAKIAGIAEDEVEDIARETGGIVFREGGWTLQNEDFEGYVAQRTADIQQSVLTDAVGVIEPNIYSERYAARSIAEVYVAAKAYAKLYGLVLRRDVPACITSEIERRTVRLRRTALAIRCSRQDEDLVNSINLLLSSAASLKAEEQIRSMLVDNIDLSGEFDAENLYSIVILSGKHEALRGRLRVQFAARDAQVKPASAADHLRWWKAWNDLRRGEKGKKFNISSHDLAAEFKANLGLYDLPRAINHLSRWQPADVLLPVVAALAAEAARIKPELLVQAHDHATWRREVQLLLLKFQFIGGVIRPEMLEQHFAFLAKRTKWLRHASAKIRSRRTAADLDALLFVCERSTTKAELHPYIEKMVRAAFFGFSTSDVSSVRSALQAVGQLGRAIALLGQVCGASASAETYVPKERGTPHEAPDPKSRRRGLSPEQIRENSAVESYNSDVKRALRDLQFDIDAACECLAIAQTPGTGAAGFDAKFLKEHSTRRWNRDEHQRDRRILAAIKPLLVHRAVNGDLNQTELEALLKIVGHGQPTPAEEIRLLRQLIPIQNMNWLIAEPISQLLEKTTRARMPASDRAKTLVKLSRLALGIDRALAKACYEDAYKVVEKVDIDAMSQLYLLSAITCDGIEAPLADRQAYAERIAEAVGAVSATLDYGGDFPWAPAIASLTALDLATALVALFRWHDIGELSAKTSIESLLEMPAGRSLSLPHRTALATLCTSDGELDAVSPPTTKEDLDAWGLLYLRAAGLSGQTDRFEAAVHTAKTAGVEISLENVATILPPCSEIDDEEEADEAPAAADLHSEAEIEAALEEAWKGQYVEAQDLVEIARRIRRSPHRVPFLDSVARRSRGERTLGSVYRDLAPEWMQYRPVAEWAKETLSRYVVETLPRLFEWHYYDADLLGGVLDATGLAQYEKADLLLSGIEAHADSLSAEQLYGCISALTKFVSPEARRPLLDQFLRQYEQAIDVAAPVELRGASAPTDINDAIAGLLFALMGDVSKSMRWRAAYALRWIALLGDRETFGCFMRRVCDSRSASFATPNVPFYDLAAERHAALALERIAHESPGMLSPYKNELLSLVHTSGPVMTRHFLQSLLSRLNGGGDIQLSAQERKFVAAINRSPLREAQKRSAAGRRTQRANEGRRYDFDTVDTLSYWYEPVARYFDIGFNEFVDAIERRIVDDWGFTSSMNDWLKEPRQERFSDHDWQLASHRHGGHPAIERLSRYLDWYGLECAVTDLLQTTKLIKKDRWGGHLDQWIREEGLTHNGFWLADLRDPPPPNRDYWKYTYTDFEPDAQWVKGVRQNALSEALAVAEEGSDLLAVSASYGRTGEYCSEDVTIRSALVTPYFDVSLARALQTAADWMDYILPPAEDHREIEEGPFAFVGWYRDNDRSPRIDRDDPFRGTVSGVPFNPTSDVLKTHGLEFNQAVRGWRRDATALPSIGFRIWGDEEPGQSRGYRGWASRAFLMDLLRSSGKSMLFEVHIKRRSKSAGEERAKYRRRLYVLRADGTLHPAPTTPKGLGVRLVKASGLDRSCDTWGRCLLHQMEAEISRGGSDIVERVTELLQTFRQDVSRRLSWDRGRCEALLAAAIPGWMMAAETSASQSDRSSGGRPSD